MSPLVRKEVRLLLPFWGIAMLLAIVPAWLVSEYFAPQFSYNSGVGGTIFWGFGLGMVLLGLAPFGQEFSLGTFTALLAQPSERRRIWTAKIILISMAALLVFGAYLFANHLRIDSGLRNDLQTLQANHSIWGYESMAKAVAACKSWYAAEVSRSWKIGAMLLLIGISGGLWATLLFRQTGAAFWFVILIPGAIYVAVEVVCQSLSGTTLGFIMAGVFILYSAIGFVWARRMFANAQDSQWLGENVALLSLAPAKARADSLLPRRTGALRALARKEFQSHQISLLIGFGLLVLHICTLVFRRFETLNKNSELRFAVEAVPFLWLFVPWLIGCVTVAEERKLGTMESQLCLPVTRRFQFVTKFTIALLLGIVLGGIMPALLEWVGSRFHISSVIVGITPDPTSYASQYPLNPYLSAYGGMILICIGAAFITLISIFASTLSRNTLHALGGAVVIGIAFFALFQWIFNGANYYSDYFFWKGPLILFMGVPVAVVTLIGLSFSNYKRLHAGGNVWVRNVFILFAILAFTGIATALIDQRPWEFVQPREPFHGPPRLGGPVRPTILAPGGRIVVLLPDGRVWLATHSRWQKLDGTKDTRNSTNEFRQEFRDHHVVVPTSGEFVGGSNWVALAADSIEGKINVIGLQSDGTLWSIISQIDKTYFAGLKDRFNLEPELRRIGSDSDWKAIAEGLAVKTNGTLWGWGGNDGGWLGTNYPKYVKEPVRIGDDSDWETIFSNRHGTLFMKRDGSIWNWEWVGANASAKMVQVNLSGADWLEVTGVKDRLLVIRRDGSLWARGFPTKSLFGINNPDWNNGQLSRIGKDSDWQQISGFPPYVVAIKGGRLLKSGNSLFANTLGQPSGYSDWLAVELNGNELVALAADGTLNMWQFAPDGDSVLAPTHRPFWSLNILTDSKN
jgi:hypothetical protein